MKRIYVEEWLTRNSLFLNYQAIETDAQLPLGILEQFIHKKEELSRDTITVLDRFIQYRFLDTLTGTEIV